MTRRFGPQVVALTLALVAGSIVSCAGGTADAPDRSSLGWERCGGVECATLDVPLDHADPGGETVGIELVRSRARDRTARRGVLLVNPGGPGGSGTDLARRIATGAPALAEAFDIVGWDPRGVGPASELRCDEPLRALHAIDTTPDDEAEREALDAAAAAVSAACRRAAPALLATIGTSSVVDDMDAIRLALGEEEISFLGFSYGSVLGLAYAERHGTHLRAAVLDGIVDPNFTLEQWLTSQAVATERALARILTGCDRCDSGLGAVASQIDRADAGTLGSADEPIGPADVSRAAILATYGPDLATRFRDALDDAGEGDAAGLLALSELYLGLASFDVYTAVVCVDSAHPVGRADYDAFVDRIAAAAPVLGAHIANELRPCATWPVPAQPLDPISPESGPLLLVGNTGDAATPLADAVAVAARLPDAVLLTHEGAGHTSFLSGNACVDDTVTTFLVDGIAPPAGTICR